MEKILRSIGSGALLYGSIRLVGGSSPLTHKPALQAKLPATIRAIISSWNAIELLSKRKVEGLESLEV